MSTEREASARIEALFQSGKVTREEADRLLSALGNRRSGVLALLCNPFERFGGGAAFGVGLGVSAFALWTARFGIRYDGFLDLHAPPGPVSLRTALTDQVASWIVPGVLLWLFSLSVARRGRLLDFLGVTGLARLPDVVVAIPLSWLVPDGSSPHALKLGLLVVLALGALGWNLAWLFLGFKNATGLSGKKLVIGFVVMVSLAEAASKGLLALSAP